MPSSGATSTKSRCGYYYNASKPICNACRRFFQSAMTQAKQVWKRATPRFQCMLDIGMKYEQVGRAGRGNRRHNMPPAGDECAVHKMLEMEGKGDGLDSKLLRVGSRAASAAAAATPCIMPTVSPTPQSSSGRKGSDASVLSVTRPWAQGAVLSSGGLDTSSQHPRSRSSSTSVRTKRALAAAAEEEDEATRLKRQQLVANYSNPFDIHIPASSVTPPTATTAAASTTAAAAAAAATTATADTPSPARRGRFKAAIFGVVDKLPRFRHRSRTGDVAVPDSPPVLPVAASVASPAGSASVNPVEYVNWSVDPPAASDADPFAGFNPFESLDNSDNMMGLEPVNDTTTAAAAAAVGAQASASASASASVPLFHTAAQAQQATAGGAFSDGGFSDFLKELDDFSAADSFAAALDTAAEDTDMGGVAMDAMDAVTLDLAGLPIKGAEEMEENPFASTGGSSVGLFAQWA